MSSILKALRKLEEQQAARRGDSAPAGPRTPRPGPRWRAPTAILAAVVLTVVVTVAVMNGLHPRTAQESAVPVARTQSPAGPAPVRLPEPPVETVTAPVVVDERGTAVSAPAGKEHLPVQSIVPQGASVRQRTATAAPVLQESAAAAPFSVTRPAPPSPAPAAPVQPQVKPVDRALAPPPPPPSITVSGIAWQKGESERIAMVNGSPVSEGTVVAGARVVEIKPDRVRFSRDGATFEVPIGTGAAGR